MVGELWYALSSFYISHSLTFIYYWLPAHVTPVVPIWFLRVGHTPLEGRSFASRAVGKYFKSIYSKTEVQVPRSGKTVSERESREISLIIRTCWLERKRRSWDAPWCKRDALPCTSWICFNSVAERMIFVWFPTSATTNTNACTNGRCHRWCVDGVDRPVG